jgi:DNA-directed RNA polymerase specialized sigma24 family protein
VRTTGTGDLQLARVRRARVARGRAETEWRASVLRAHLAGYSYREIATSAGVHFTRIAQIVNEERGS